MNAVSLDYVLLPAGLLLLVYGRLTRPNHVFQAWCQFVGTFWAGYGYIVNWSLGRLTPMFSATSLGPQKSLKTPLFLPFACYCLVATTLLALTWQIPECVSWAYGEGRAYVQLVNLVFLALCTHALSTALLHPRGPQVLRDALGLAVIVHGFASLYQQLALLIGLPLIAISRAHTGVLDVASFQAGARRVFRPGGLAGEPKNAAVLFGIYLCVALFTRPDKERTPGRIVFETTAAVLAATGFLLAWSTSSFVGFVAAIPFVAWKLHRHFPRATTRLALLMGAVALLLTMSVGTTYVRDVPELMEIRTVDRIIPEISAQDAPIRESLRAFLSEPRVTFVGTGLGGSSFLIMRATGRRTALSYGPNIGFVRFLVETGIAGAALFLVPCALLFFRPMPSPRHPDHDSCQLLLCVGTSALSLNMSGSGIALGLPLAVASLCAYAQLAERHAEPKSAPAGPSPAARLDLR